MEALLFQPQSWLGILGSVGLVLVSHVARKYVIPFLAAGKRQRYAEFIAMIADDLTDELRKKYPDKQWLQHLDEAVDLLISVCDVGQEVARRAINAAAARKQ